MFNIFLAVVPNNATAVIIFVLAAMDNVCRVAFDPLVPLVVLEVEISRDMGLDEECADAAKTLALIDVQNSRGLTGRR